jgi:hypothetical protein
MSTFIVTTQLQHNWVESPTPPRQPSKLNFGIQPYLDPININISWGYEATPTQPS